MRGLHHQVCKPGFTLLEVLVSLAIFALAVVVLGATYVNVLNGYDAVARRNQQDQGLAFIRSALLAESDRKKAEQGGDLALPGNRAVRWSAQIEEAAVADLFQIELRCEIRDPARAEPWVNVEKFLLLRPTWSDPGTRDKLRQSARERLERRNAP